MPHGRCLIFQRDRTILLSVASPAAAAARDALREFSELIHSSGAYHAYRVTELSLWGAAASGLSATDILDALDRFGEHPPPLPLVSYIQEVIGRYGLLRLVGDVGALRLASPDQALLARLAGEYGLEREADRLVVPDERRGWLKCELAVAGYPVIDEAALAVSESLPFDLARTVRLRPYQDEAVRRFIEWAPTGGVVLLPCGAGKTVVGVAVAARLRAPTLILTPSRTISEQWRDHFLRLTTLGEDQVTMYQAGRRAAPVTVATYQAVTSRSSGNLSTLAGLFDLPWGLIIYDEVQSLPADVFRKSAALQARRRLGLTATLVREDGRERDVFSLVGPTVCTVPWRDLERRGWIAPVECVEVRIRAPERGAATADRVLARKIGVARALVARHSGEPTLVVAHRLLEVAAAARALGARVVTGQTPAAERRSLYDAFRRGEISCLVLSRVANVGVDLPDASVLVQISGAFGSRQEEAQRLGRLLRPKEDGRRATFYSLVAEGTREVEYAARRQRFLIELGYRYRLATADSLLGQRGEPISRWRS